MVGYTSDMVNLIKNVTIQNHMRIINMKKVIAMIMCVAFCTFCLAGCGEKQVVEEETTVIENDAAVVGTWTESNFDSGYTFNADGTGKDLFWDLTFSYTALDGVITITYDDQTYGVDKYTYTVGESDISMARQSDGGTYTYTKN